ncbi:hypothetical protein B5S31_g5711 [[Candida] boidinii]|nr:hypothetical protein B5S31_g5711 [[Candida] boidinii]OWB77451.1 hypothetical protein B5S32_g1617 [[Candida] boidinii]
MSVDNKKLTNRESINIKKQLQEKFQLSLSNLDSKVLSWLPSPISTTSTTRTTVSQTTSNTNDIKSSDVSTENNRDNFLNLPIIGQGCGISFDTTNNNNDNNGEKKSSYTVGDFINGGKSSSTKTNGKHKPAVVSEGIAKLKRKDNMNNTSKAMNALKNKLRNDNRNKFKNENQNQNQNQNSKNKNQTANQLRFQSLIQRNNNTNNTNKNNNNNKNSSSVNQDSDNDEDDNDEVLLRKSKSTAKKSNLKSKRPF